MKKISDEQLLTALIVHGGVTKTAAALGMTTSAIYKRLTNPNFRRQYDEAQGVMLSTAATAMADALNEAVNTLLAVIRDEGAAATVKVSAADAICRHCCRYVETATVLRRLDALEAAQNENI